MTDLIEGADGVTRCRWAEADPLYVAYHDDEWGRPIRGDDSLFELLTLEGFQAGLSWLTILRKREAFRAAFAGFRIGDVAAFVGRDVDRLLGDAGIVRNRAKIEATIGNARAALELGAGGLTELLWSFAPPTTEAPASNACGGAGGDFRVEGALEGAEAPRLPLCRPDDPIRVHAVGRDGGRPPGGLRDRRLVGAAGLEPATSCSQSTRATRLRHAPN